MTTKLSIKECLSAGWDKFKARPWFFVGTFVIYAVIQGIMSAVLPEDSFLLTFLVSLVVSTFLYMGLINIYLKGYENPASPSYKDFWHPGQFWNYLGATVLVAIVVVIGLILLVVPGIILGLALSLTGYLVIDRNMKPIEAMKESMRLTKGNRLNLLGLGIVLAILTFIGAIPLFLGLLVVAPITMLSGVHAYRTLSHGAAEIVAAPAPSPAGS